MKKSEWPGRAYTYQDHDSITEFVYALNSGISVLYLFFSNHERWVRPKLVSRSHVISVQGDSDVGSGGILTSGSQPPVG